MVTDPEFRAPMVHQVTGTIVRHAMTRRTFLLPLLLACSTTTEVPLETEFTLRVGDSVAVRGTELRLVFVEVSEDSRCPVDATCVWVGSAPVVLAVRAPRDTSLALDGASAPVVAAVGEWRVELRSLQPAPRAGVPIPAGDYAATLRVTGAP